jgi:hypothetical protein
MPNATLATPLYLTQLDEKNCKFYDTINGVDVWMTPTNELICQFGPAPSQYACMPYDLAKRLSHSRYKAAVAPQFITAVAAVELHRSQGN